MSNLSKKFVKAVDIRGSLIAFNSLESTDVKRCFLVTCKKDAWRGKHYHKKTTQTICVVNGSLESRVLDGKSIKSSFLHEGDVFRQEPGVQFEFRSVTDEAVIIVMCNTEHDPEDYFTYET